MKYEQETFSWQDSQDLASPPVEVAPEERDYDGERPECDFSAPYKS